jgi:hypothetical protein
VPTTGRDYGFRAHRLWPSPGMTNAESLTQQPSVGVAGPSRRHCPAALDTTIGRIVHGRRASGPSEPADAVKFRKQP